MTSIEYKEDLAPEDIAPGEDPTSYFSLEGKHVCLAWCKDEPIVTLSFDSALPRDSDDEILHGVMVEINVDVLRELAGLARHPRFIELLMSIGSSPNGWPVRNADFYSLSDDVVEELVREPFYG